MNVLLMAYGTPYAPEEVEPYYTDIRRGRRPSEELLKEMSERLAHLCAIALSTLDPGLVVIGGPLAEAAGEKLLEEVRKRLPSYALKVHEPDQVVLSPFGRDAALLGAGALAASRFVDSLAFEEVM